MPKGVKKVCMEPPRPRLKPVSRAKISAMAPYSRKLMAMSFTVSNVGSLGIEAFTPVVNPPQTGILGVCALKDAFRMNNGQIEVYPSMTLCLSYDHRALDGTPASKFLRDLKVNLENFNLMLAKG